MRTLLLATVSTLMMAGGQAEVLQLRTTLRAESLRLPQSESLGLLGLSGTANLGPFYVGPGLYGAARGMRGGFFTFGLEGGLRGQPFRALPLELDAGVFIGGGGGGNAPQGGGLMLRPHLGLSLPLWKMRLGAELSRVTFLNGAIHSTQAALSLAYTTSHLWAPEGEWGALFEGPVSWQDHRLSLGVSRISPSRDSHPRLGPVQHPFDLAGFSFDTPLQGPWFLFLSAAGAARGGSAGYAQALTGLGFATPIGAGPFGLEARLGTGLGGGGDVNTGGGLLLAGEGNLTLDLAHWSASAGVGFLRAPSGAFQARSISFKVSHRLPAPRPEPTGSALSAFQLVGWRVGTGLLVYHWAQRYERADGALQLMTLQAEREVGHGLYLKGEAGSATGGRGGGYATGLAGLGYETPAWCRQRLFLEALVGAGGGGLVHTSGGALLSARSGWRLEGPQGLGIGLSLGRTKSSQGSLDTATLALDLRLRFQALRL